MVKTRQVRWEKAQQKSIPLTLEWQPDEEVSNDEVCAAYVSQY